MNDMFGQAIDFLRNSGFRTISAIVIFIIGVKIIKNIVKIIKSGLLSTEIDSSLVKFILTIINFFFYLFMILYCLSIMKIPLTGFVATLSALTLAVGLSIQSIISSVANGIMLVVVHPFKVGDYVDINGVSGTIMEINVLHTILNTPDNRRIIIPNSSVFNGTIINYSANHIRRIDLTFSVDYDTDMEFTRNLIIETVKKHSLVLSEPQPLVKWNAHNDSYIEFVLKVWTDTENYWTVSWDLDEMVCDALMKNGIEIPFPQVTLSYRKNAAPKEEKKKTPVSESVHKATKLSMQDAMMYSDIDDDINDDDDD